jgi:hypothetical protein
VAGKWGSNSVSFTLDDAPGGTGRDITAHITSFGGVKNSALTSKVNGFGTSAESSLPTGMKAYAPIPFEGFYDTTSTTGPHAVLSAPDDSPQDATRSLVIVFGDGKTASMEGYLTDYEVLADNGQLTKYRASYTPNTLVWS